MPSNRLIDAGLVLLGAVIGFIGSEAREWLAARRIQSAFLKATQEEIKTIQAQLMRSGDVIAESERHFRETGMPPQFNVSFPNAIFSAQFAHLRDASDARVLAVANLYSSLGVLQGMGTTLNEQSAEYFRMTDAKSMDQARNRINSILRVLSEEIAIRLRIADSVLRKISEKSA